MRISTLARYVTTGRCPIPSGSAGHTGGASPCPSCERQLRQHQAELDRYLASQGGSGGTSSANEQHTNYSAGLEAYKTAKAALDTTRGHQPDWNAFELNLVRAHNAYPLWLYEQRLDACHKRTELGNLRSLELELESYPEPANIDPAYLQPNVHRVNSYGAYVTYSSDNAQKEFVRKVRQAKDASVSGASSALESMVRLYLGFVLFETDLLTKVDVAVSVPPKPGKATNRLPDHFARGLEQHLCLTHLDEGLEWNHDPGSQRGKGALERCAQVKKAMRAHLPEGFAYLRVLIVDDVVTTGCTVREAARALRAAGASECYVASLGFATGESWSYARRRLPSPD